MTGLLYDSIPGNSSKLLSMIADVSKQYGFLSQEIIYIGSDATPDSIFFDGLRVIRHSEEDNVSFNARLYFSCVNNESIYGVVNEAKEMFFSYFRDNGFSVVEKKSFNQIFYPFSVISVYNRFSGQGGFLELLSDDLDLSDVGEIYQYLNDFLQSLSVLDRSVRASL